MKYNIKQINENSFFLDSIFKSLSFLRLEYPGFYKWYHKKVMQGLSSDSRKIFLATTSSRISQHNIDGVLILKNTLEERKICTLFVKEKNRYKGIGAKLMDLAMNEFHGEKPLITISDNHITSFNHLLNKYEFKVEDMLPNYYTNGRIEYTFNGHLYIPEDILLQYA